MILVDTSVWIDHLRQGNKPLEGILNSGQVLCHPFIAGELACGNLKNRDEVLILLNMLPEARIAEHFEVMRLVNIHRLHGSGLAWIDMHLLAAALLTGCRLWTLDKRLMKNAAALKIPT